MNKLNVDTKLKDKNKTKMLVTTDDTYSAVGMCFGIGVGALIGRYLFSGQNNASTVWMCIGMCACMGIGACIHRKVSNESLEYLNYLEKEADLKKYCEPSFYIDYEEEGIQKQVKELLGKIKKRLQLHYDTLVLDAAFAKLHDLMQVESSRQEVFLWQKTWMENLPEEDREKFLGREKVFWRQTKRALKEVQSCIGKDFFEWVRDEISHSMDAKESVITTRASEVLKKGTGLCYAKANLLTAMYRLAGIPAGLCYQHLTVMDNEEKGYCLHGFVGMYINGEWMFVDPRGNKKGVDARYDEKTVKLAFPNRKEYNEFFLGSIWEQPINSVMRVLEKEERLEDLILPENIEE